MDSDCLWIPAAEFVSEFKFLHSQPSLHLFLFFFTISPTKACIVASIIFVLDKKTELISAPHALVYFGIVIFFVYFKVLVLYSATVFLYSCDNFFFMISSYPLFCLEFMIRSFPSRICVAQCFSEAYGILCSARLAVEAKVPILTPRMKSELVRLMMAKRMPIRRAINVASLGVFYSNVGF